MAESKEYIVRSGEDGSVNISEDVIGIIALEAMREVEGFGAPVTVPSRDITGIIGKKTGSRGVRVTQTEDGVMVDVFAALRHGCSVARTAAALQEAVRSAVEDMTGITVCAVNIHVNGISFDAKAQ